MTLFTEIDLSDKALGYKEAVLDYIERFKDKPCGYQVEFGNPRFDERYYPSAKDWSDRLHRIDDNRVCARLIEPTYCDVRNKFIAEVEFCGPFGKTLEDMYYMEGVTFALSARKHETLSHHRETYLAMKVDSTKPHRRTVMISSFDFVLWDNHEDNPANKPT